MQNKQLAPIKKVLDLTSKEVSGLVITDSKTLSVATEYLSKINKYADNLESEKKKITDPLNLALKNARAMFKPLETVCESLANDIRSKMTNYQTALVAKQKEKEAKIAEKVASGKISIDKAVSKFEAIEKAEGKVETESGSVAFVETQCFEVIDLKELPLQYHLADEVSIRKAMKDGVQLAGVKYWTEMRPRNSR